MSEDVPEDRPTEPVEGAVQSAVVRNLATAGGIGIVGRLGSKFLSLVIQAVLTRVLGPSAYGRYVLGLSVTKVGQQIGQLGLREGVVRYGAIHHARDDDRELTDVLSNSVLMGGFGGMCIAAIIWIYSDTIAVRLFADPAMGSVLRVFVPAIPAYILLEVTTAHFQAFERIDVQQSLKSGIRPIANLGLVIAAFALGYQLHGAIGAYVVTGFLTTAIGGFLLLQHIDLRSIRPTEKSLTAARPLLQFSIPMLVITMSFALAMRVDRLMLGMFHTAEVVGIYNVAAMISQQFSIVIAALITIFKPMISTAYANDETDHIEGLYRIVTRWASFGTIGLFVVVGAVGPQLLRIFGPSFVAALPVLSVLPLVYVIGSLYGPCAALLRMTGRLKLEVFNAGLLLVLNIVFNLALIPEFGAMGAALGVLLAGVTTNLVQISAVYVIYGFHPFEMRHLAVVGYTAVAASVTIASMLHFDLVPRLLVTLGVGLGGLWLFVRQLRPVERQVLKTAYDRLDVP